MPLTPMMAQSSLSSNSLMNYSIIGLALVLLLWAVLSIAKSLLQVQAESLGVQADEKMLNLFPSITNAFIKEENQVSFAAGGTRKVTTKKGYDLKLAGEIKDNKIYEASTARVSVSPYNFRGIAPIPKLMVKVGDSVKAGDPLFFDKSNPDIKYVAPVSGEIVDIVRGAKRSIADIVILVDKEIDYKSLELPSVLGDHDKLVSFIAESGLWVDLNERPFDIVPELGSKPRDIFVSTFDTAPLAPNSEVVLNGNEKAFQKGLEVLSHLTDGKVHVGLNGNIAKSSFKVETSNDVVFTSYTGKHPVGNVGIQIHKTDAIRPTDKVWTITYQDVIKWGNVFLTGKYDGRKVFALAGYGLSEPRYVESYTGASIKALLATQTLQDNVRIISGDVLSGHKKDIEGFASKLDDQITVIKEGDEYEFMGWLLPFKLKPTTSRTFPSAFMPNKRFEATTNTNGEERAFVVTGQFEKVLPMNIYVQHLMKSILTEDFEKMEGLGIHELTEEDVAICEFVSVSKAPLQKILRDGLDFVQAQG